MTTFLLPLIFMVVALVYSAVGLGGGSTYVAILALSGMDHQQLPTISLSLNLVVTSVGIYNFRRHDHIRFNLIWPFLITSLPMAYLGGSLQLSRLTFLWLLFITLLFVALRIYLWREVTFNLHLNHLGRRATMLASGAALGFVAGTVGIGGGILLVPLMIMLSLAREQEAAGAGAVFVWVNSAMGLFARFNRQAFDSDLIVPLVVAVIVGAGIGSYLGAARLKPRSVQLIMGVVILMALVSIGGQLL